jgi:hypothetical protein
MSCTRKGDVYLSKWYVAGLLNEESDMIAVLYAKYIPNVSINLRVFECSGGL